MSNDQPDLVAAEAIARRHPAVEAIRSRRGHAVLAEHKPPHRGEPDAGQVVIAYVDREKNESVVALVDRNAKSVVAVQEASVVFQLSEEEQKDAEALAAGDRRVIAVLRGRSMNPLTRLYFPTRAAPAAREHRHAIVFLRPNERERHYAVIDLSAREVVDVLSREALAGR